MKMLFYFLFFVVSNLAWAIDCPVKYADPAYLDKVSAAIRATSSCDKASEIAEACALGASGDAFTVPVAERKCGLDFWKKLSSQDKKVYNQLQAKCDEKYKGQDGTMYISFQAFCRLSVAKLYSELYTPAEGTL